MAEEVKAENSTKPHDTVTANRLNPNVEADGTMKAGAGVGAQSPEVTKKEGIEHINDKLTEHEGGPSTASAPQEPISEENKTSGVAVPTTDGSAPGEAVGDAAPSGEAQAKDLEPAADPKTRENHEAIPSAGGERLGEKHWGESKVVPDNPKPQAEEAGVASAAGQPTSEVKDNTFKNTGTATGAPGATPTASSEKKKEKFTDKLKDRLKLGKKDKA